MFPRPLHSKGAASHEKFRVPIWPEWNDADINAEKWDTGKAGKEKPAKGQISVSCVTCIISTSFFVLVFNRVFVTTFVTTICQNNVLLINILILNHILSKCLNSSLLSYHNKPEALCIFIFCF